MEGDVLGAATAPLTFHDFLERMKQPAAADLVRSIKSFIVGFGSTPPNPEQDSEKVQQFLRATEQSFTTGPVWAGASREELESAGEGLEKYLMSKLYSKAFAPLEEEVQRDVRLSRKMAALQHFIRPEHLDIPSRFHNDASWLLAQKELQKLGSFKAPRDKLVCILNCCRLINNLLLNASLSAAAAAADAASAEPPGADDFLPVLIYVVIRANPPQLLSNLLYIQRYRHSDRLVSESAYFFTNMLSASTFIESLSAAQLSMAEGEFERQMAEGLVASSRAGSEGDGGTSGGNSGGGSVGPAVAGGSGQGSERREEKVGGERRKVVEAKERVVSVGEMERSGAVEVLRIDSSGELAQEYRFLYAQSSDLRVGDVDDLLKEYKNLALKYSSLCRAIHGLKFALPDKSVGTHAEVSGDLTSESKPKASKGAANADASVASARAVAEERRVVDVGEGERREEDVGGKGEAQSSKDVSGKEDGRVDEKSDNNGLFDGMAVTPAQDLGNVNEAFSKNDSKEGKDEKVGDVDSKTVGASVS